MRGNQVSIAVPLASAPNGNAWGRFKRHAQGIEVFVSQGQAVEVVNVAVDMDARKAGILRERKILPLRAQWPFVFVLRAGGAWVAGEVDAGMKCVRL